MSSVKRISLGDDFGDVVITANHATVAIHGDGSVESKPAVRRVIAQKPEPITDTSPYADQLVPIERSRIEHPASGGALQRLIDSAATIARKFGHSKVTFVHLTAAILENAPHIAEFVDPKMKIESLQRLVQRELEKSPGNASSSAAVTLGDTTAAALARADWITEKAYRSDSLLPLEVLREMIKWQQPPRDERCATVDYMKMTLNAHYSLDESTEARKAINRIASTLGELKNPPAPQPPGPGPA